MSKIAVTQLGPVMISGFQCRRCGHRWRPYRGSNARCYRCEFDGALLPTEEVHGFRCRCGHEWQGDHENPPSRCPKCGSHQYDKPKAR